MAIKLTFSVTIANPIIYFKIVVVSISTNLLESSYKTSFILRLSNEATLNNKQ